MEKRIKYKKPIRKTGYSTRATQSILQYGVGSLVDFPDQTLMTAAPEYWNDCVSRIHDRRLEKALNIDYIGMPGTDPGNSNTKNGISYVRFPEWYFCPVCRRFQSLDKWIEEHKRYNKSEDEYMMSRPKCYKCNCNIVVTGLITVCENGHIDDFPWIEWAHIKGHQKKEVCGNPSLKFMVGNSITEGLQGLIVKCVNCNTQATLSDAFSPDVFKKLIDEDGRTEFKCQGKHPWKGTRCNCGAYPVTKQRGDTSVYFSNTVSSIVIPTAVEKNESRIENSNEYKRILTKLEDDTPEERTERIDSKLDLWSQKVAQELLLNENVVKKILKKLLNKNSDEKNIYEVDSIQYRYEEYEALSGEDGNNIFGTSDFLREEMNMADYDVPGISKIVLVKKMREVVALIGYSRLKPARTNDLEDNRFVPIKDEETNWYPGYEVRGEGIFIQFNYDELDKWSQTDFAIRRREMMNENLEHSMMRDRLSVEPDAKFLLLHTISHLLLKQLSYECGYNVASLRERIYYMPEQDEDTKMAGILLYTASGDSEGTLGGLVRQGRSDIFPRVFKTAIEKAKMCSNDPVCITSKGQGRESLNLATCHACGLLPETSCEQYNILLDRAVVIGTFEEPNAGFYSRYDDTNRFKESENRKLSDIQKSDDGLIYCKDTGTRLDMSFDEIWDYIKDDCEYEGDIEILSNIKALSEGGYEKPIYDGEVAIGDKHFDVNLIWENAKVLFLLEENADNYTMLNNSEWKCFCESKEKIDPEELLKSIKER